MTFSNLDRLRNGVAYAPGGVASIYKIVYAVQCEKPFLLFDVLDDHSVA